MKNRFRHTGHSLTDHKVPSGRQTLSYRGVIRSALALLCSFSLLVAGCSSSKKTELQAYDLNESLNIAQILETISLKTAQAHPEGFAIIQANRWMDGVEQTEKTLVLQGEPFYTITLLSNPQSEQPGPVVANALRIEKGKQQNLNMGNMDQPDGSWILNTRFDRAPIYDNVSQAGAVEIMNAICADSTAIIESYPDEFTFTSTRDGSARQISLAMKNREELMEKISKNASLSKAGNTLGSGFMESLLCKEDGVLDYAMYSRDNEEASPNMSVEVTVTDIDTAALRQHLNELFASDTKEGAPVDLGWIGEFF